ncbi:MAG: hypothetical protein ACRDHG_00095 [Anaerolineales bacterium]
MALIDRAGNELEGFQAKLADTGEYLIAEGGPTEVAQVDIRVTVLLADGAEPVEMDFTLSYAP